VLTHRKPISDIEGSLLLESDAALVCRAKQDTRAFAPLYERYRDDVLRYAFHCLRNWEDAADVSQQTFANALGGLASFQDTNDSFRRWLFRIARNEVINRRRQQARRSEQALHEVDLVPDVGRSPEELAILTDEHATARALFLRLTPAQRQCCALRFAGMSHRETAARIGKSEEAVRASYSRGVAAMRVLLDDSDLRGAGLVSRRA
jgi:RNA polymerase sigma factor (sigma-70 family)